MTRYALEIKLLSPLVSGAGEGRAGVVDREVAFDDLGLPMLPGRRIKGLWRESYRDVADAWTACGKLATPAERIFGRSGQGAGDVDACMRVGSAELLEAASMKAWLTYLQAHDIRKLHRDDVVQHFATVRAQTAIDRHTGAARENTLRLTRTVRPDLVFHAPVRFVQSPDTALIDALALGAAALQHMGTGRTRGFGKVSCRLLAVDTTGQSCDLTERCLNGVATSLPQISPGGSVGPPVQAAAHQAASRHYAKATQPTHIVRYRLKLSAPVVIPNAEGDPNTIVTRHDVPGSHLFGVAAWCYLRQPPHGPTDPVFRYAFLDSGLRFLPAYPEVCPTDEDSPQRMIPVPHSIRRSKERAKELIDLADPPPRKEPTERLNRRHVRIRQWRLETQAVKTERSYHHARTMDRRTGRALGAEIENGGAFFQYEAMQAGQSFQGAVLGSEQDLERLQGWLREIRDVRLGRSRSAQYGEAELEWLDDAPRTLTEFVEWGGFVAQPAFDAPKPRPQPIEHRLVITTLSPLLTVNDHGHPEACFPDSELASVLGLARSELKLLFSYSRTEVIGGYQTHLRLPRQQWPAIAAGSVFVFATTTKTPCAERLLTLEHDGLGLRKGEGYGRVAVNRQHELELTGIEETQLDDPDNQQAHQPGSTMPPGVQKILRDVIRTACLDELREYAMTIAGEIRKSLIPSNALLARMRLFILRDSPVESLEKLRDPARDQLTTCKIDLHELGLTESSRMTLYDLFMKAACGKSDAVIRPVIERRVHALLDEDSFESTRRYIITTLIKDHSSAMCRAFLDNLLTALRRRSSKHGGRNV